MARPPLAPTFVIANPILCLNKLLSPGVSWHARKRGLSLALEDCALGRSCKLLYCLISPLVTLARTTPSRRPRSGGSRSWSAETLSHLCAGEEAFLEATRVKYAVGDGQLPKGKQVQPFPLPSNNLDEPSAHHHPTRVRSRDPARPWASDACVSGDRGKRVLKVCMKLRID